MPNNSIKITDTTLRDGQQSILATRLRTEDIIAEILSVFNFDT